jgi:hypothetical protein
VSNETILKIGTPKTLEANGASITNNAIAQADDATYGVFTDGGSYPDAKFVLSATFGTAPSEGTTIALYAQPLDIDGTSDADIPETTRPTVFVGVFVVNNVTTTQYIELLASDVPWLASYYLHNNGTGQTISAGWTLKVTPATRAPAP